MMEEFKKRIADFWKERLTKQERHNLLKELQDQEENIKTRLEQDFQQGNPEGNELLSDIEYRQVLAELHQRMLPAHARSANVIPWKRALVAAAVLLVGIGTSILVWKNQYAQDNAILSNHVIQQDTIRLANREQVAKQAVLVDGSTVVLSPGSTLTYLSDFGLQDRILHLQGEGRFKVAKDTLRPFVVWADGYTTTALGTEFSIDTRDANQLRIALLSGKVVVESTSIAVHSMEQQYLVPGDQLNIQTKTGVFALTKTLDKVKKSDPEYRSGSTISPVAAVMKFENTPLQQVFETIARIREVSISVQDDLLTGLTFTGEFRDDESLEAIVGIICQMNNLAYTESGDQIYIQAEPIDTSEKMEKKEKKSNN